MGANKKVLNATVVEYDGLRFRSKLEVFCYKKLIEIGVVDKEEMTLLNAWIADFRKITS